MSRLDSAPDATLSHANRWNGEPAALDSTALADAPSPTFAPLTSDETDSSLLANLLAPPRVLGTSGLSETQRKPAFHDELLTLYRTRLRLLGVMAMLTLPMCALVYALLVPRQKEDQEWATYGYLWVYGTLFIYALLMRGAVGRLNSLTALRLTTLASYAIFSAGASVVIALLGDHNPVLYSAHLHIILSALLLPFTVWECAVIGAIALGAFAWAGWWSLPGEQSAVYASYIYLLATTTVFVLCVTHFQSLLRRRAFDAAFDLVRINDKLQLLSFMDTLTGGFNRRYLEKTLGIEIARALRFARPLSVMMFDLDNFKQVNDTRGHAAGDEVLREVWQGVMMALREVDTAARYGGDEFSAILPETDEASARAVAERLQASVRFRLHNRFGANSPEGRVTLSIGIVTARPGDLDAENWTPDRLIDAADERLYEAKRHGKNLITS